MTILKVSTDIVFVILVYRNYSDLYDLCKSLKLYVQLDYKIVIVDAFYNEKTSSKIKECAKGVGGEYICVENKGYGYGNNRGIEYAEKYFEYKFLCICNPDTVLKSNLKLKGINSDIACIAPIICTSDGKFQNPYWAMKNKFLEWMMYIGYKKHVNFFLYVAIAINKFLRILFNIRNLISTKSKCVIYACHGSFFLLTNSFLNDKKFRFDEEMFLFFEEAFLAFRIELCGKKIIYDKSIKVYHKEDGSMKLASIKEYPYLCKSYVHYYEKYRKRHGEKGKC